MHLVAARLRLPKDVPLAEKEALVEKLIRKLSLVKAADTIVGSSSKRGISGGERKRLATGCELLGDPNLLFSTSRRRASTRTRRSRW